MFGKCNTTPFSSTRGWFCGGRPCSVARIHFGVPASPISTTAEVNALLDMTVALLLPTPAPATASARATIARSWPSFLWLPSARSSPAR